MTNVKECPQCKMKNFGSNKLCKSCGFPFDALPVASPTFANTPAPPTPPLPPRASATDVIRGILWLGLCGYLFFIVVPGYTLGTTADTTAFQQTARAADACFAILLGYAFISALTEALKAGRGK